MLDQTFALLRYVPIFMAAYRNGMDEEKHFYLIWINNFFDAIFLSESWILWVHFVWF
jgi:hypothetical protein